MMKYFIVDVFCKEKYSGNQLAVIVPDKEMTTIEMQKLANEFHFSETTFILMNDEIKDSYRVRIFTPYNEVPFAGHPTLGTAFVIRNELIEKVTTELILDLNAGKIHVTFDDDKGIQWMRQNEPVFGLKYEIEKAAEMIGLTSDDVDTRFPIQGVSTGIEFMIIPLKNLKAVKKASINNTCYKDYFSGRDPMLVFIFCSETYEKENTLNCRMFADYFGIPEDPATGSANGCLAAYLTCHNYFNSNKIDITVEQGYEIGRKSILHIKSSLHNEKYNIDVGGKVIKVAEGVLV